MNKLKLNNVIESYKKHVTNIETINERKERKVYYHHGQRKK